MSSMIPITLDYETQKMCVAAGFTRAMAYERQYEGKTTKRNWHVEKNRITFMEFVSVQADSAAAECVVAYYRGIKDFMPRFNTFRDVADVADNIEVKHTRHKSGHLIIFPDDRPTDVAVLVVGQMPQYYIAGWMPIPMIQVPKYKVEAQGNYWVNQSDLFEMRYFERSNYASNSV